MNTRQSSKKEWTLERKNALMGYIMVSPILVGILLFTVVPVFFSLYISFTDWDMLHPQTWVGLQNYQTIFSDKMLGIVTTRWSTASSTFPARFCSECCWRWP